MIAIGLIISGLMVGGMLSVPSTSARRAGSSPQTQKPEKSAGRASKLHLAPCSSTPSFTPISFGQTVMGQLSADDCTLNDGSYADLYEFSGVAGQQITINLNSSNFDTLLLLRRGVNEVNVAEDDDSGDGSNSRIPPTGFFSLPATGRYIIFANSFSPGQTGNYSLTLTASTACVYALTPAVATFGAAGGTGSVNVTTFPAAGCNWTATSNAAWIPVTGNSEGNGNGTASYAVAPNSGPARTGTITIAGRVFTVTQAGTNGLFAAGDVFVAITNGQVQWRRANGTLIQTLSTGESGILTGMAFDKEANLYVTGFLNDKVYRFSPAGTLLGTFGGGYNAHPESIVFDRAGNVYVGQADGNRGILRFDAAGNLRAGFAPAREARGTDWIELAEDQCTLFYTSEGKAIKRFNVCTNTSLSDFVAVLPGSNAFALRLLPGGGLIVADREEVVRYDAAGTVVRKYDAAGENYWFAANLDPDGTSFWSADQRTGNVYKFDLATGNQLLSFNTGTPPDSNNEVVAGLVVLGEIIVGGARADLALTQTVSPNPVAANANLTYTLTVRNNGPDAASFVTVTDNLPAGLTYVSCAATGGGVCAGSGNNRTISFPALGANASATITLVAAASCAATTIANTATVSAPTATDLTPNNNSATTNATVTGCGGCPTITVNPANSVLPFGALGAFYTQTFTQTGGAGTVAFSIVGGALPPGLALNSAGILSGTPAGAGTFNFTVRAMGGGNCFGERAYTLLINSGGSGGIVVTSASDVTANNGACTLREAILNANNNNQSGSTDCAPGNGRDTIRFNIPGPGPHTIAPTSPLPTITDPAVIDATTQPGASCTTPGGLKIELNGANAGNAVGLNISAGNSVVRGFVVNRFADDGVRLHPNGGNTVSCNYIGTDVAGQMDLGNGVQGIQVHSPDNIIGGTTPGEGNLISGNANEGVNLVGYGGNQVLGNLIGTNANGTAAIPNRSGVFMNSTVNNVVGGRTAAARNLISGNESGVFIFFSSSNQVLGNYIGTDPSGARDLGNSGAGVVITGESLNNVIGGSGTGATNIISGNDGSGIVIGGNSEVVASGNQALGNWIGVNAAGTGGLPNSLDGVTVLTNVTNTTIGGAAESGNRIAFNGRAGVALTQTGARPITGIRIQGNQIYANGALGLDVSRSNAPDGVTANDAGDGDAGPNNLQNFPTLTAVNADGAGTVIVGTLNSAANAVFTLQFFSNPACDSSGNGEGQSFLGQTTVTTDAAGNAAFNTVLPVGAPAGSFVTATATDSANNTSEFSPCRNLGGGSLPTVGGAVIIDGTDANDHGDFSNNQNIRGWLYMQKVLENLATKVSPGTAKVVVNLGASNAGGPDSREAIQSAFDRSFLPANGWRLEHVDTAANITAWLTNLSTATTGILYIPTYNLFGGDLEASEMAAINAQAVKIANYINRSSGNSGALFAMGEAGGSGSNARWGWLRELFPGISFVDRGTDGVESNITLTPDGMAAFPGLTNADLALDPNEAWHNHFTGNLGTLKVLGVAPEGSNTRSVILGGVGIVVPEADLAITQTASPNPVGNNANLTFTLTVRNNGPDAASEVVITDNLPANTVFVSCEAGAGGVCAGTGNNRTVTFASLAAGASATVTIVARANCSSGSTSSVSNTAGVVSATRDSNAGNNSSTAGSTILNCGGGGRTIKIACPSAPQSGTVRLPIELISEGNENALGFSLNFDPAVLSNPQVSLGNDAAGASLNINSSQTAQGRIGIALALSTGQSFAAGTRQIVVVTFTVAANTSANATAVDFGDAPIRRQISDSNAQVLPAAYQGCTTIGIAQGFESDVTPSPNGKGNGTVSITDWVKVGRFAAGLDVPASPSEFQRADCAPRTGKGDGVLSVTDWVQAGRYAAGLDPVQTAGGPSSPQLLPAPDGLTGRLDRTELTGRIQGKRKLRVIPATFSRGRSSNLKVAFDTLGDENAFSFSLDFDPSALHFVSVQLGRDANNAALIVNASQADRGRIGIVVSLPPGQTMPAGTRFVLTLTFNAAGGKAETASIGFGDFPSLRQVSDFGAKSLPVEYVGASISITNSNRR